MSIETLKNIKRELAKIEDDQAMAKLRVKQLARQALEIKEEDPDSFTAVFSSLPKALTPKKAKKEKDE